MHELFNALGTTIVTTEVDKSSCTNLHCGPNSLEEKLLHHTDKCTCVCKPNYVGNPILGCRPGCLLNSHCPVDQACHNFQCTDPCPGTCGQAALCMIINQKPMCLCPNGFSGNPYQGCQKLPQLNDNCKVSKTLKKSQNCMFFPNLLIKNLASVIETAKCQEGYVGQPPYCRPECVLNSDCLSYVSCINGKCQDPCQNGCGENADCKVIRHQAVCSCKENTVGNPYKRCSYDDDEGNEQSDKDQENGGQDGSGHDGGKGHDDNGKKRCRQDYDCQRSQECISGKCQENGGHDEGHGGGQGHDDDENGGRPCRQDYDCKRNQACVSGKCQEDGGNGGGHDDNENGEKQCRQDYDCKRNQACISGKCQEERGHDDDENGGRSCRQDYECKRNQSCISGKCQGNEGQGGGQDEGHGDNENDERQCRQDYDCKINQACISGKCQGNGGHDGGHDGGHGDNEDKKHCRQDYECERNQSCTFGKCQENGGHDGGQSQDDNENGGRPCRQDYDCKRNQACISGKCQGNGGGNNDTDIDQNTNDFDDDENRGKDKDNGGKDQENDENGNKRCREDYDCKRNQACISGICQEDGGHRGGHDGGQNGGKDHDDTDIDHDFDDDENRGKDKDIGEKDESQDCNGQKCGQYAKCVRRYRHKSCQCLDGYSGTPPFCTPQCRQNYDCNRNQTCKSGKCQDNTNDFDNGGKDQDDKNDFNQETDCNGQKCGQFAKCVQRYRHKSCQCLTGYSGTPPLCTPQCRQNYDCNRNQACISGKCQDSCSGACGLNAKCTVTNHLPRCFCQEGYEGDPYEQCNRNIPPKVVPEDQTYQNDTISCPKCGFNAQCEIREEGSSVSCKCMKGYLGDPQTGCRPECILSSECEGNEACLDKRCQDPCASTCGVNAKCSVVNHFAVCTCQESYSGNPFKICTKIDDSTFY